MNEEKFLEDFANMFEITDPEDIKMDTDFRELEEWDSLIALSLIAMADEEYGVTLTGDDIRLAKTIADLFEKVKEKQG